ncbi:MAG: hypothetical protein ACD_39C01694G0004 [uncultured bacterium]|nr:MAG: hypothetical protein ACD_39C01694G0004 [uncultured bacterium]
MLWRQRAKGLYGKSIFCWFEIFFRFRDLLPVINKNRFLTVDFYLMRLENFTHGIRFP